jgi:hypothetical protein
MAYHTSYVCPLIWKKFQLALNLQHYIYPCIASLVLHQVQASSSHKFIAYYPLQKKRKKKKHSLSYPPSKSRTQILKKLWLHGQWRLVPRPCQVVCPVVFMMTRKYQKGTVDANLGQHTNALDRAARKRARCSSSCVERSDRSKGPVGANFGCQHMPPSFFCKACLPKNILLSQNCLRAMINTTSAIFFTKGDKQLSAMFCSSRCWNNLFGPPHLLHCRWRLWHDLHLLFHCLLRAHTLQPSLLSMRQVWETPPRL